MIQILSDKAICMCPHGGQLQFMPTHMKADGMDGQALTMQDYTNAMIVGCAMPPPPAGVSPCLKVLLAIDPMGQAMKVNGNNVVTQMVVSFTDKGWPIIVVSPGMSAMSINIDPSLPSFRKAEFAQASVQRQSGLPIGAGSKQGSGLKPFKDVIMAYWGSDYARRKEKLILKGRTIGFGDGTPATLLVYKYDLEGSHKFIKQLAGSVKKNEVEVPWQFDYPDDVAELPNKIEGDEFYAAPEYFFELKVGGKSARSGLIEFRDWVEIELKDQEDKVISLADFVARFADGSTRVGSLDSEGKVKLLDVPPGKVFWSFAPKARTILSAEWLNDIARRDEVVKLKVTTQGFINDTPAKICIYQNNLKGDRVLAKEFSSKVRDNTVEGEWTFSFENNLDELGCIPAGDDFYHKPEYFYEVEVEKQMKKSELLEFRDWVEIELVDENGKIVPNMAFIAQFADGSQQKGNVNNQGRARLNDIPPGKVKFAFLNS